jgi:recombination DNA repair RAD52 pathway protein
MAFSDTQSRQLKAKLDSQYVKARKENGTILHYIEGWHAIAEANRIFGFDAWDHPLRVDWDERAELTLPPTPLRCAFAFALAMSS